MTPAMLRTSTVAYACILVFATLFVSVVFPPALLLLALVPRLVRRFKRRAPQTVPSLGTSVAIINHTTSHGPW